MVNGESRKHHVHADLVPYRRLDGVEKPIAEDLRLITPGYCVTCPLRPGVLEETV